MSHVVLKGGKVTTASQRNSFRDEIRTMEECMELYVNDSIPKGATFCEAVFDGFLCWPQSKAGSVVHQNCPPERLSDTTKNAFRTCGDDGFWRGKFGNESDPIGWTNYTPCFPSAVQNLLKKVEADPKKLEIARNTRTMEIIGFSLSLVALIMSLYVFCRFRPLRNIRTKIHKNLFLAMIVQVVVRLIVYLDQAFSRDNSDKDVSTFRGLDSLPYVCEGCYIALEYGISAMFCWMFIEGLYLHSIVTANALREFISYRQFLLIGWGTPVLVTGTWAVVTAVYYQNAKVNQCWYGYNFLKQYWVNQAPRLTIIMINFVFLLNIMRVLIVKMNRTADSEMNKVRKAVRAALVLLPLLGITNILNMVEAPLDSSVWKFALWSYITHFLRSFQGLLIALIYCFFNGEVRQQVVKMYRDWRVKRNNAKERRERLRAFGYIPRRSSGLFGWVQSHMNGHGEEEFENIEMGELRRKSGDNKQSFHYENETNVTDDARHKASGSGLKARQTTPMFPYKLSKPIIPLDHEAAGDSERDSDDNSDSGMDDKMNRNEKTEQKITKLVKMQQEIMELEKKEQEKKEQEKKEQEKKEQEKKEQEKLEKEKKQEIKETLESYYKCEMGTIDEDDDLDDDVFWG